MATGLDDEEKQNLRIVDLEVIDIRYPMSNVIDSTDGVTMLQRHTPDYAAAYVILRVDTRDFAAEQPHSKLSFGSLFGGSKDKESKERARHRAESRQRAKSRVLPEGHGFAFTIGRGTEIVVKAIEAYRPFVVGKYLADIWQEFGAFWEQLVDEEQIRWIGPEKGAVHMAVAAIVNALWDLRAKLEGKPLWKLLVDMSPEELISSVSFRHVTDCLTSEEALSMLQAQHESKWAREQQVQQSGVPAYVTSAGFLALDDEKIKRLGARAIKEGWTRFKMKVGVTIEDDRRRAAVIRQTIGDDALLMMDANQNWEVDEAIGWMQQLAEFKPVWIEEPTNPDDVAGHKKISDALKPLGIGVASGEHCQNRVLFKQYLASGALQYAQIDACRLAGVNEAIVVMLLAHKYNVPVCPHAGGVGLCELVQHLAIFNYVAVSPSWHNVMVEYSANMHEHMVDPVKVVKGHYQVPKQPGFSSEMGIESRMHFKYPTGTYWHNDRTHELEAIGNAVSNMVA